MSSGRILGFLVAISFVLMTEAARSQDMRDSNPPSLFCDRGLLFVEQKVLSFDAVLGNDANGVANKDVLAYGYIGNLSLPGDTLGKSSAQLFAGEKCYGDFVMSGGKQKSIEVIFDPSQSAISQELYKDVRRLLIQSVRKLSGTALLKFSGQIHVDPVSGKFNFVASAVELVAKP